jgi:hypothetical protein
MSDKTEQNNKNLIQLYEKKLLNKPFVLDKVQPKLGNKGDEIQEDLDHIAKITEEIIGNIKEEKDIIKVNFKKKKSN